MKLSTNKKYTIKSNHKDTVDVMLEYLGYQKDGKPCFLIWSEINPSKSFITLGTHYLNKITV